jgi:hypothetical protein
MNKYLRYELQMPICLARWITGRRDPGFAYHQAKKLPVTVFMVLLVFESLGTHLVLLAIFGGTWWAWTLFGLDVYTWLWLFGYYGSLVVLPHQIDDMVLRLRYGYLAELLVPLAAIKSVRRNRRPERKGGKLIVDGDEATFACGETTVTLELDPDVGLSFRDERVAPIARLHLTVDDPTAFIAAIPCSLSPPGRR